ncbi:MAG TPA: cytochrome P460 family protein [Rhizomicrobium sp.]|nr:cytochrome P460 family protein [Rhizomicrobium sp.]
MSRKVLASAPVAPIAASFAVITLAVFGGGAIAQQNKETVKVPDGLALSEFKGYEKWQVISVSQNNAIIDVIVGNPEMIAAYQSGLPAEGKKFPDGVKMVKIHWNAGKQQDGFPALVPSSLHDLDTMVKDSSRFAATGGWGYGQFNYDAASDNFMPLGTGPGCGFACHTKVAAKDYVFTLFPKR